ncbi:E3 ubiquitin-protein ligase BRE1-like 2 isoform X1 [Amborella trichopoda]|uniref:E3 ubiquitin-protein ligase BRE1-like 2 isoform X1 n=1 Tax=Amborella trichopoda TaxID=13333 RepID=UPI0009C146B2|nr:E3 ubiquitin-protein ligase BRE1-like 2 isoform X1 [Amborella trichopoda]|eukprot:XP_020526142.1 E3 ubiquitin-protein ligase BRE1-like 2 isoform X1 [Amborella trichopoda]
MGSAEEEEEPEKKRPHLSPLTPMAKKQSSPPPENRTVDAAVLQYENQKLFQQLDTQKNELHALQGKFNELKDKQISYDETLIAVNRLWNQLEDDLVLLGIRAGSINENWFHYLDHLEQSTVSSCPSEETFLWRLLEAGATENGAANGTMDHVQQALVSRQSSTLALMVRLEETIAAQRAKSEALCPASLGNLSSEDAFIELHKIDNALKEEVKNMCRAIDVLHLKHKAYAIEMQNYLNSHTKDQTEIKRLTGELEEIMTELEESRRKLVNLKMQKNVAAGTLTPVLNVIKRSISLEKCPEKNKSLRELKDALEEAKTLATSRLSELQDAHEENLSLSKKLRTLQNDMKDDKYVVSSRPYIILSDRIQRLKVELERYKGTVDTLQADRNNLLRREKEMNTNFENADAAKSSMSNAEARVEELELQLRKCITEKNDLEMMLEETEQDAAAAGRNDIKAEFRVMVSALSKETGMMEAQLNRSKAIACEVLSLSEEVESLTTLLNEKISEHKILADRCAQNEIEIKLLKAEIEKLQTEKQELQIFLDMYGQECYDSRDILEIKESERRTQLQADLLKSVLDEHGLELRVKAANEVEAACQQRLSAAEAEIADLRAKLDASERDFLELKEAIKLKEDEGAAYISEIETIGQAYEDMQTQNQHLLQQVTERDDFNIKLVSESVKTKQAQGSLIAEKQAVAKQLQQVNASLDYTKVKIARDEEQMKAYLAQAEKASQENRHIAIAMESAKLELVDAEKELKWLKSALDSSERDSEQSERKLAEVQIELENERLEKKKLEEELEAFNSKVAQMSSENEEAAVEKLQDEIKEYKAILKCGVCYDRPKEVGNPGTNVITTMIRTHTHRYSH